MAENNHIEDRTVQLAKRVELLLNHLPDQGEPLEARKLKHATTFSESLAKELASIKAEYQERLRSAGEKETAAARALGEAAERSQAISQETAALQKNQAGNVELSTKLAGMISAASGERASLDKEREAMASRATELTKREEVLRAGTVQLERDRAAGLHGLEQSRAAHENKVGEDGARIQQQSDELEQSRLAHNEAVTADRARAQELRRQLDERGSKLDEQAEDISLQKRGISTQLQALESERNRLSTQSARVTQRQGTLEAREKTLGEREEQLRKREEAAAKSETQCKEFVTGHNSQVNLFNKTCADYMSKQKQIDKEKEKVQLRDGFITAIRTHLQEEQQTAKDLRAQLGEAETKLAAQDAQMRALEQASAEKDRELGEILGLLQSLNISGETMSSATDIIRESTESVKKLESELSSKLEASEAVERDLEAAHADADRLNKAVASRDETIAALERQEETARQARREAARAAETQLAGLQAQVRDRTSELSGAGARLRSLERELEGEREKVKDLAHARSKHNLQDDLHRRETEELKAQHALEVKRLEGELRRHDSGGGREPPRGHQPPTPMTSSLGQGQGQAQGSEEDRCTEWQELLGFAESSKSRLLEDEQALDFLWTLVPSVVPESKGQLGIQDVFLNLARMANDPQKRGTFQKYVGEAPPGWYCFALVSRYGHGDQDAADSDEKCKFPRHSENCLQVRIEHGELGMMDFRKKPAPGE